MSRLPAARTVQLFAVPIMVQAGGLACLPFAEATLEEVVPRLLAACVACAAMAWVAASVDSGRGGPAGIVAGLAIASLGAGAFAFATCLCISLALAGTVDAALLGSFAFIVAMLAVAAGILGYVLANALVVRPAVVIAAIICHCVALTPLMLHPARSATVPVSALAFAACLATIFLARRQRKKKPAP